MEVKNIRTRNDLIEWIMKNSPDSETPPDEAADWFVAVSEARAVSDGYSLKDMAHLFLSGVKGIEDDPEEYINNWLGTFFEDVDGWRKVGDEEAALGEEEFAVSSLTELLENHFGLD